MSAGTYANKFSIELGPEVARVVFMDERAPIAEGIPKSIAEAGNLVMTRENWIEFARVMGRLLGPAPS
jgi:hypothetical protein